MSATIYAVGFQSVDPDEGSIGGHVWSIHENEIAEYIESSRTTWRMEVDFEYLRHTLTVPEGMTDKDEINDWVDATIWERTPEKRVVILGDKYPGGERRRIAKEMEA